MCVHAFTRARKDVHTHVRTRAAACLDCTAAHARSGPAGAMVVSSFVMRHVWVKADLVEEFDFWCKPCGAYWVVNAVVAAMITLLEAIAVFCTAYRMVRP
jgi:hypothetical protein